MYFFSLNHAIWDSCGHLGGRPRCITVRCRGVRSLVFLGQFCPTISIKVSTAKVRQFSKCGGIRAARITRSWGTLEHRPRECRASPNQGYTLYRPPKIHPIIISGGVPVERTHGKREPPRNSIVLSHIDMLCVQGETAQIPWLKLRSLRPGRFESMRHGIR